MKTEKKNEIPQESVKNGTESGAGTGNEKVNESGKEKEVKRENESGNEKQSYGWIFAIVLAVIIVVGLAYGYTAVTGKNRLTKICNDIAASKDLKYPTTCVPFKGDSNYAAVVDQKSDPMCKCSVDMGNGTVTVIDVRVAK